MLVAGLAIAALALLSKPKTDFKASIDAVAARRIGKQLFASGTLTLTGPAQVEGPGLNRRFTESGPFELQVLAMDLKLGTNPLPIRITPDSGAPVQLSVAVNLHYRLSVEALVAPQNGGRIRVEVETLPQWKISAAGATAERLSPTRFRLGLDASPLLEKVDRLEGPTGLLAFVLELTNPQGEKTQFNERLVAPLPTTRLTVWRPLFGQVQTTGKLTVSGRATPGASVTVAGERTVADATGRFSLTAKMPSDGAKMEVVADGEQRLPAVSALDPRRLSPAKFADMTTQLRAGAPKTPRYRTLLKDLGRREGERVTVIGRIAGQRRGRKTGVNIIQLSTCQRGNRCPVWVETTGPVWVDESGRATVIGRLAGLKKYANRAGLEVEAPRLTEATLLPWR